MMKILWSIAKKDLLQVTKDKTAFLFMLVMPLVLIAVIGSAFNGFSGDASPQIKIKVALSNQDTTADAVVGTIIRDALSIHNEKLSIKIDEYRDASAVRKQISLVNNAADVGIVIPARASQTLRDSMKRGSTPQHIVQFYALPNNNDTRVVIVQNMVNQVLQSQLVGSAAVLQVQRVCEQQGNYCAQKTVHPSTIRAAVAQAGASTDQTIQSVSVGRAVQSSPFDQSVPGYAIFFALFGLNAVAATILQEKEDGTFRRLLMAPIQKYALLGGKLLAQFILTMTQLTIIFVVGYFVFKMHVSDWPAVILLLIGTSFASTGLGILLVSVVKTRRQLHPVISIVTLVTSAIGGAWWPLSLEPEWMQKLAKVGITAWAMEGLHGTMILGRSFADILPNVFGLFAYGTICFLIALRLFRFQENVPSA